MTQGSEPDGSYRSRFVQMSIRVDPMVQDWVRDRVRRTGQSAGDVLSNFVFEEIGKEAKIEIHTE